MKAVVNFGVGCLFFFFSVEFMSIFLVKCEGTHQNTEAIEKQIQVVFLSTNNKITERKIHKALAFLEVSLGINS